MMQIIAMPRQVGTQTDPETEVRLEDAEFFRALPRDVLAQVSPLLHERRLDRQRVLFFEGRSAEFLWVVRSGEVRLYKSSPGGQITTLEVLGPGEIFGAVTLAEVPYSTNAEVVSEGRAWCLPGVHVRRLLAEQPALAVEILQVVSARLHEAHERLRSFAHDSAPQRLARALLRASITGEAHVTRRALAEASGTTVETAIRVLRRFEREGIIRGEVGLIHVIDESALQRAAGSTPG
jgi:CRP/FNR family transcriptional regulator